LRKAVRECFPDSWVQRCQAHRMRNTLATPTPFALHFESGSGKLAARWIPGAHRPVRCKLRRLAADIGLGWSRWSLPSQILLTRAVFDSARQSLKGEEVEGAGSLSWLNHGRFELKGVEEPVEICEVRAAEGQAFAAPTTSEKARRVEAAEGEAVLGWRPAVGQVIPNTRWVLENKLGEGGFGEVWLGRFGAGGVSAGHGADGGSGGGDSGGHRGISHGGPESIQAGQSRRRSREARAGASRRAAAASGGG